MDREAEAAIAERYRLVGPGLNERQRRSLAAAEARTFGPGGIAAAARACRMAENTVRRGIADIESPEQLEPGRVRLAGAGRKPIEADDLTLLEDLEQMIADESRGDPECALQWTARSVRNLADALGEKGHEIHFTTVPRLLRALDYSLQANRKTKEGSSHPDRDAQFRHINTRAAERIAAGEPVISVDTKKKENVGDFKAVGRELRPKGDPIAVRVHDFKDKALGKAAPYGVLDLAADEGFVSVGISNDTAEFSVASIRSWWEHLGKVRYANATTLMITADCGGSNGYRTRLWKTGLQNLADETGLAISVSHFPPGTSKWNKIEHRLWSFVARNWRGKPLVSHQVIVNLIGATKTRAGLEVFAQLDEHEYPKAIKVSDAELAAVNLVRDTFHGEWNYTINPLN